MRWLAGLSAEEKREMFEDACEAFSLDIISQSEFVMTLVKLGYNATDIEGCVKLYRPSPPENEDGT